MLQSPLIPKVALLISAGAKAQLEGKDPTQCPKALAMRGNVLALVNDLLKREMYVEAIHAVVYLVHLEVRVPQLVIKLRGAKKV
jgi:hypothetical protein